MSLLRRALAWVLVGAGSALVAFPALTYGTAALRQSRLSAEVRTLLGPASEARTPAVGAGRPSAFRPTEGQPLGTIEVPSVGIRAAFLEGVTDQTLLSGPGHLPGTALPGADDVSVLAAHRDMHFRNLKDVQEGARVTLRLPGESVAYRVVGRRVVRPDDASVTEPVGSPVLRLVTCWPPDFIGPAPERLVVSAVPLRKPKATRSPPPEARSAATSTTVSLAPSGPEPIPAGSQAPIGTAGAALAGVAAYGATHGRRRMGWWFLPWMGGLGLAALMLLAAWAGPGLARRTQPDLVPHREAISAGARWEEAVAVGGGRETAGSGRYR